MPKKIHGESKTRFYRIFCGMKYRSTGKELQKSKKCYKNICIDDSWKDYVNFKKDMFRSYNKHIKKFGISDTTLDRLDSKKGYSKTNCRWATKKEQMSNTSRNIYLTYKGETKVLAEWGRFLGVHPQTLKNRIDIGLPIEQVFEKPIMKRRFVFIDENIFSINEAAKKLNLTPQAIFHRIKNGMMKEYICPRKPKSSPRK